ADNHNSPPAVIEKNSTHFMDSFSNIIAGLNLDSEKILLLALIIVLLNEGADTTLILALCYLLI
ncbi:MAG: hypothetical protein K0R90_1394, partial [Oscillospiraceae bacterium]|nr:hypothetical protein [Oscillospiraceae bacterium]